MRDDSFETGCARLDDLARKKVGVDERERVGWGGEKGRDGGFPGRDTACQADDWDESR